MQKDDKRTMVLQALPATIGEMSEKFGVNKSTLSGLICRLVAEKKIYPSEQAYNPRGRPNFIYSIGQGETKPLQRPAKIEGVREPSKNERERRAARAEQRKLDLQKALELIEGMGGSATSVRLGDAMHRSAGWASMLLKDARTMEALTSKRHGALVHTLTPGWRHAINGEAIPAGELRHEYAAPLPTPDMPLYGTPWQQLPMARLSARAGA